MVPERTVVTLFGPFTAVGAHLGDGSDGTKPGQSDALLTTGGREFHVVSWWRKNKGGSVTRLFSHKAFLQLRLEIDAHRSQISFDSSKHPLGGVYLLRSKGSAFP